MSSEISEVVYTDTNRARPWFDWRQAVAATGTVAGQALLYSFRGVAAALLLAGRWLMPRQEVRHDEVPVAEPTLALAAKIALDELGYAFEVLATSTVAITERHRIASEVTAALSFYGQCGWLEHPQCYHEEPPPLHGPILRPARSGAQPFEHMEFDSGYEPHSGEPGRTRWLERGANRTAHAWVLRHGDRPRPWLVCLPGYRMGTPLMDFVGFRAAWLHHSLGLDVIIPVLPLHGPRATGVRSGSGFLDCDYLDTIHAVAQSVWDVRRILTWLRAEGAAAIGVHGISLGGYTTALLAGLDRDLACVIAGIPPGDLGRLLRWHTPPPVVRVTESAGLNYDLVACCLRVVSPLAFVPRVPHDRRFIYGAVADQLVPPDHARDLWRHWERPAVSWYPGGHISFLWDPGVQSFVESALRYALLDTREEERPSA
jgi:dienelactone hydrolase